MNETVLCNKEDDAVTGRNLHCNRKIIGRFGREKDINAFLLKLGIIRIVINLDDMQLQMLANIYNETCFCASSISHRKGEEFCLGWCAFQLKFCKSRCMTFNRLTDTSILGIKLHIP